MKKWLTILLLALIIASCEKSSVPRYVDVPIVEAYLKVGGPLSVKISHAVPFDTETTIDTVSLDTLQLQINDGTTTYTLAYEGNGIFVDSSVIILESTVYDMNFNYAGTQVTAYTTAPSKPTSFAASATSIEAFVFEFDSTMTSGPPEIPDPIELTWDNYDGSNYLLVVESIEDNAQLINDTTEDDNRPSRVFRNSPTKGNTLQIRSQQFSYYGLHNVILYHLNEDYAALYDESNSSSQNLSTPKSTISQGQGIFTATNSDTIKIRVLIP